MADSIKELIQAMNGEKTTVVQGFVTSAKPLRIALVNDAMINLPSDLIIVPEYLTEREKEIEIIDIDGNKDSTSAYIDGKTENGGTSPTKGPSTSNTGASSGNTGTSSGTTGAASGNTGDGGGGNTGEGGSGVTGTITQNIGGTDYWHNHSLDGHTHSVSSHSHSLNDHTHSIGDHSHSLNDHTHSLNDHTHSIDPHKHDLKIRMKKVKIKIDDSLKVNELVHLLSVGQGKIYYVLGRV